MIRTHMLRAAAALGLALGVAACEAPPAAPEAATGPGTLPTVDMAAAQAAAMGAVPLQVLDFSPTGTRSLTSRIRGDAAPAYAVPVAAGQTLTVVFRSANHAAAFNLMDTANPAEADVELCSMWKSASFPDVSVQFNLILVVAVAVQVRSVGFEKGSLRCWCSRERSGRRS